jgi:hypothetical protein
MIVAIADDMTTAEEFKRARALASRGRRELAKQALRAVLAKDPDNNRALAVYARLDAESRAVSRDEVKSAQLFGYTYSKFDDAKTTIRNLIDSDPSDPYLKVQLAIIAGEDGHREQAIADLRAVLEENPDDSYVRQVLAGQLGCQYATLREAWAQWDLALQAGPLSSPGTRVAAYWLARRFAREKAPSVLAGARAVERAVVRTLVLDVILLFFGFWALAGGAFALRVEGDLSLGCVAIGVATLGVGWVMFASFYVGVFRYLVWWAWSALTAWLFFLTAGSTSGAFWIALAVVIALSLVWMMIRRRKWKLGPAI